jgi:hypothetical protein
MGQAASRTLIGVVDGKKNGKTLVGRYFHTFGEDYPPTRATSKYCQAKPEAQCNPAPLFSQLNGAH